MNRGLREALVRLSDAHRRGANLLLLFDYDGTLVPFAERPSLAILSGEIRRRLERLARIPAVHVGVLSGRWIDDVRHAVGIDGLFYSGTGGLELFLGKRTVVHPEAGRAGPMLAAAAERVQHALADHEGAWVERKPLGLTVHYRAVRSDRIETLRAGVTLAIEPFRRMLRVLDGAMAIEIVPNLGWTKGSALRTMVAHVGGEVLPLYAGDDANDADALGAAADLGGIAVGVGPNAPAVAQYRVPDPVSLRRWLARFPGVLSRSRDSSSWHRADQFV